LAQKIKKRWKELKVKDLYAEPITGGSISILKQREAIGRYGLTIDVNNVVEAAIGGMTLTTTIEGRQRFSVNARYAQI
jgi:Cu(I)/Ag(I) efflux system membrane protein CusA/SilA